MKRTIIFSFLFIYLFFIIHTRSLIFSNYHCYCRLLLRHQLLLLLLLLLLFSTLYSNTAPPSSRHAVNCIIPFAFNNTRTYATEPEQLQRLHSLFALNCSSRAIIHSFTHSHEVQLLQNKVKGSKHMFHGCCTSHHDTSDGNNWSDCWYSFTLQIEKTIQLWLGLVDM